MSQASEAPPPNYTSPPFPSLGWVLPGSGVDRQPTLYYITDIWRFTLLWTLITFAILHLSAAALAMLMHGNKRLSWKFLWAVPVVYGFVAAIQAIIAGSVVGLVLGAVYSSGSFYMSMWVPFIWGWIIVLVLVISSFTIQGGL